MLGLLRCTDVINQLTIRLNIACLYDADPRMLHVIYRISCSPVDGPIGRPVLNCHMTSAAGSKAVHWTMKSQ